MDYGHKKTDQMLRTLERKISSEYAQAYKETKAKADKYFARFAKEDKAMLEKLHRNEITLAEYTKWRNNHILMGRRWDALVNTLAQDMSNANAIAIQLINDKTVDVYALNYNFGAYEIEHGYGIDTSLALVDHNTVERLLSEDPQMIPMARLDIPKDLRWNRQKITSAMMQGILQGESIDDISKRLRSVTGMNKKAAIRNARTYTTAAENGGRLDSYTKAKSMGIELEKEWEATLDGRTRTSHRHLDRERVPIDEKFSNGCRFPADPDGRPEEIYNCRCRMVAALGGYDYKDVRNYSKLGMSYDEWLDAKPHPKRSKRG